ncbi:MAG: YceG family protein [Huintestinicola sp.]|uniref:YceG family protein n=1 Tax=Huintestinicola sp. TaxID=2981661 RepID=UPI003F0EA976
MNILIPAELLSEELSAGGHFLRINKYGTDTEELLLRFFALAVRHGAFLEKGMANPTAGDIAYFESSCAMNFKLDRDFIKAAAKKCCNASDSALSAMADSFFESLSRLKSEGKNDSILKNTFIKFMCWLRRDIARALAPSKEKYPPKILCKGGLSRHEMMMLAAAVKAGCDVLIAEYDGAAYFDKLPECEKMAALLEVTGGSDFPSGFTLADIRKKGSGVRNAAAGTPSVSRIVPAVNAAPALKNGGFCVNAWISGNIYADILTEPAARGNEPDTYYTCYARINGAENKTTYLSDLYSFYMKLRETRDPLVIDKAIELPSNEEINSISRGNYRTPADMTAALSQNIVHSDPKLQGIMRNAFCAVMDMYFADGNDMRKGISKAVFLLCWLKRYQKELFGGGRKGFPCLIIFGGCRNASEAMFVKMIARCPADVLILRPELGGKCELYDDLMYERNFTESLPAEKFPREGGDASLGTVAYYAERELDSMMYTDTGIYRSHQYAKANAVVLRTMYEEIPMLWSSELKFRPNFSVSGDTVNIPVIMAKISGVKDKDLPRYWNELHEMAMAYPDSTLIFKGEPITNEEGSCEYAVGFMKNGRLNRSAVKAHKNYNYGFLKEETQDYILDKLSSFLEANVIKDQKSGGLEYRIIHIALNMGSDILRIIQKFDFTAVNPKVIYIATGENVISRADSILLAFLSKLGFDVVFYVPTGYQSAEKYYNSGVLNCLETGEYMFDLQIPDLSRRTADPKKSIFRRIFGKDK